MDQRGVLGIAGALLAALTCGSCGATRFYEGPERSREEVAVISGYPRFEDTLSTYETVSGGGRALLPTRVYDVDGRTVDAVGLGGVEVLPGPHTVHVRFRLPAPSGTEVVVEAGLTFDARANGDYEILARVSRHTAPAAIDVYDRTADVVLLTTEPQPEVCVTARIAWDGPPWTIADWGCLEAYTTITYLPPGETLDRWTELVEMQRFTLANPPDLHELMATHGKQLAEACTGASQHELESSATMLVYSWGGIESSTSQEQQGVTCLHSTASGYQLLTYAVHGVLTPEGAATWSGRFKTATLVPPTSLGSPGR